MADCFTSHRTACALALLLLGVGGDYRLAPSAQAADLNLSGVDPEEDLPDMNSVRSRAEAGRSRSQTQLGDFYLALSDYTNAVGWYQKAAEQNDVSAQLTLAGCFVSGLGVEKNPGAAATWLRKAANLLEMRSTNKLSETPHLLTQPSQAHNPPSTLPGATANALGETNRLSKPTPPLPSADLNVTGVTKTNSLQVNRINTLLAAEPDLLEIPPALRQPSESR